MWPRTVRASHLERTGVLPGDELIPEPIGTLTHAITIRRPARDVWPWLAQMGAGNRAGWYSYDVIDNGRRRSAARIVEELQHIGVGTLFPAVRACAARGYPFYGLPRSIGMPFIRFGHFIMQRRQLLGIACRAESRRTTGTHAARSEAA
jgi:hypothetical protein